MKKFLSGFLILVFILVPVGSILACTSATPDFNTVKLVWPGSSTAEYTYYLSKSSGNIKIVRKKITQVDTSTNSSNPVIKVNGVTLNPDYISKVPKIKEPATVPGNTQTPAPVTQPAPDPQPAPTQSVPDPQPAAASSMQSEMLGYINVARAEAGLSGLVLDEELCQGALLKSKDMAVNNYFSHTSPTYGSPFDMMKSLGITYSLAGENIAKNSSVKGAHDAFMNSSEHRANILNAEYNKVGLGFYQDGNYLYVTQWFTN